MGADLRLVGIRLLGRLIDAAVAYADELQQWRDLGARRYFLTVGWDGDVMAMVTTMAEAKREASTP